MKLDLHINGKLKAVKITTLETWKLDKAQLIELWKPTIANQPYEVFLLCNSKINMMRQELTFNRRINESRRRHRA